nr:hypothetical protein [uncultured Prevotella sp.]
MSNEVMTRNSEWMNHVVNHLNRMVDNFERAVMNSRMALLSMLSIRKATAMTSSRLYTS